MADNVLYREPQSGTTLATKNVGGAHQQVIVVGDGTTNTAAIGTGSFGGRRGLNVLIGPTDVVSDLPVVIDYGHHQNHEGEAFQSNYAIASLNSGNSQDFSLNSPTRANAIQTPHLVFEVISTAETDVYLYAETTFSGTGTANPVWCRNRGSTNVAGMTIGVSPTISGTNIGNLIWQGLLTGSKNSLGGNDANLSEWILKSNKSYLFRVTSRAAGDKLLVRFNWYEDLGV